MVADIIATPLDRLILIVNSLWHLVVYAVLLLVGVALLTRPAEAASLIFGERILRIASRLLRPVGSALGSGGAQLIAGLERIGKRADALVGQVLGSRDPSVARSVWVEEKRDDPAT